MTLNRASATSAIFYQGHSYSTKYTDSQRCTEQAMTRGKTYRSKHGGIDLPRPPRVIIDESDLVEDIEFIMQITTRV